jgi:hypothetical protein
MDRLLVRLGFGAGTLRSRTLLKTAGTKKPGLNKKPVLDTAVRLRYIIGLQESAIRFAAPKERRGSGAGATSETIRPPKLNP